VETDHWGILTQGSGSRSKKKEKRQHDIRATKGNPMQNTNRSKRTKEKGRKGTEEKPTHRVNGERPHAVFLKRKRAQEFPPGKMKKGRYKLKKGEKKTI